MLRDRSCCTRTAAKRSLGLVPRARASGGDASTLHAHAGGGDASTLYAHASGSDARTLYARAGGGISQGEPRADDA